MQPGAFTPLGQTINISAPTAAPPVGVQVPQFSGDPPPQADCVFRIRNTSLSNDIRAGYGPTSALAQTNAAALPSTSVGLGPGQVEYVAANGNTYWSALALTATTNVEVTPGYLGG